MRIGATKERSDLVTISSSNKELRRVTKELRDLLTISQALMSFWWPD